MELPDGHMEAGDQPRPDVEFGTFKPAFQASTDTGEGEFVRIGNRVIIGGIISLPNAPSITGLPWAKTSKD